MPPPCPPSVYCYSWLCGSCFFPMLVRFYTTYARLVSCKLSCIWFYSYFNCLTNLDLLRYFQCIRVCELLTQNKSFLYFYIHSVAPGIPVLHPARSQYYSVCFCIKRGCGPKLFVFILCNVTVADCK